MRHIGAPKQQLNSVPIAVYGGDHRKQISSFDAAIHMQVHRKSRLCHAQQITPYATPNKSRRFAFGSANACLVSENCENHT